MASCMTQERKKEARSSMSPCYINDEDNVNSKEDYDCDDDN